MEVKGQNFCLGWKLSCNQLKYILLHLLNVLRKPHGNHKAKTYSRYTNYKEQRIKAYYDERSSIHEGRWQERKNGKGELQNNQKTVNKMVLVSPSID